MLTSVISLLPDVPKTLLQEHYRCHPKIIGFCNQKYYQNELVVLTDDNMQSEPLIVYKTVKGNHARGTFNQRQIDVVMNEVIREQGLDNTDDSVGIITPYRKQVESFDKAKAEHDMAADTVHKYQGREKDVIILSTVVNELKRDDFADDPNLINVAVSRAVKQLIIVEKVLTEDAFQHLDYVLHQPLRMLIKDSARLTDAERKFAMNEMTHTDFLIFNKLNKQPVLVVEVDGHAFHANNPAQLKRDGMKDDILEKYGIPIVRMKTTGSEEEKVLREKLEGVF